MCSQVFTRGNVFSSILVVVTGSGTPPLHRAPRRMLTSAVEERWSSWVIVSQRGQSAAARAHFGHVSAQIFQYRDHGPIYRRRAILVHCRVWIQQCNGYSIIHYNFHTDDAHQKILTAILGIGQHVFASLELDKRDVRYAGWKSLSPKDDRILGYCPLNVSSSKLESLHSYYGILLLVMSHIASWLYPVPIINQHYVFSTIADHHDGHGGRYLSKVLHISDWCEMLWPWQSWSSR